MTRGKIEVTASISYFDFDFGDEVMGADAFCKVARATLTEDRSVELNVKYLPPMEEEEQEEEEEEPRIYVGLTFRIANSNLVGIVKSVPLLENTCLVEFYEDKVLTGSYLVLKETIRNNIDMGIYEVRRDKKDD